MAPFAHTKHSHWYPTYAFVEANSCIPLASVWSLRVPIFGAAHLKVLLRQAEVLWLQLVHELQHLRSRSVPVSGQDEGVLSTSAHFRPRAPAMSGRKARRCIVDVPLEGGEGGGTELQGVTSFSELHNLLPSMLRGHPSLYTYLMTGSYFY